MQNITNCQNITAGASTRTDFIACHGFTNKNLIIIRKVSPVTVLSI